MTRILIVDDDQSTLASLSRAFRLAGYAAVVCDHAARATTLLQQERFDIVFSDVVMPGKDGLAMLAELREAGVSTPIIMISGQASVDMAVRATRLGAADFLEKPISSDKLLLTVENTLRLARLEEEKRQLRRRGGRHELVWTRAAMQRVMGPGCRRGDAARDGAGRPRRAERLARLHPRRDRYRQGTGGARDPRTECTPRAPVRQRQLRGRAVRAD